jgi:hypothetical protein
MKVDVLVVPNTVVPQGDPYRKTGRDRSLGFAAIGS